MASKVQPGSAPGDGEKHRQSPWSRLVLPLALLLGIVAGASVVLLHGPGKPALPAGAQQSAAGRGFYGTPALPSRPAPPIDLHNYLGQPVTLAEYRGKAVPVAFLYTNCPDVCPLMPRRVSTYAPNLQGLNV
jgi:cytochrome oxidase Cu insertion factor (SCO1/SenC/PrrC family)